jgi:3-oxoacyl-[acyl-carrier protein] reductase
MRIDFEGQSVLVAGAARGIGRAVANAFVRCGASVFAGDKMSDRLHELGVDAGHVDVTDRASTRAWVAAAEHAHGRGPDVLVYVAGGVMGQSAKPIEDVEPNEWRDILDANLTGAFLTSQAVAPAMKRRRKGRIVFITSRGGLRTSLTGIQAYASAKAGEIGLARQLGQELGPFGITVNTVAPGFQRTSPDYERQWGSYSDEKRRAVMKPIALGRLGAPDDVANAVLFFASDLASFVTGQTLSVSGSP